jgi:hypothetical protein
MPARKTLIAQILLGPRKGAFFTIGGKFPYRHFKNVTQPPLWLNKKIAAERIAIMLYNNVLSALSIERANRMFARDTI